MYKKILIPLENSEADRTILSHIRPLAKMCGSSLLLVHVADGWAARHFDRFQLRESEEMKSDTAYLESVAAALAAEGFKVDHLLALGDPANEIIKVASEQKVDLIAMSTHGHRFISDLLYGSTVDKVRHIVPVPVLLLKAQPE